MTLSTPAKTNADAVNEAFQVRVLAARYGGLRQYALAVHGYHFCDYQDTWEVGLDTLNQAIIVCPPDTYKSTTVRMWVERAIGLNPNIRILWIMNAGEQAQKQVMTIESTIKHNPVFKAAFNVEEDTEAQWTKSVMFVKRDLVEPNPTLMATGLNGPYQGLHFDVIIIDDPTNQEDVRSPTSMEYQRQKIRGVIIDRLIEGGRIFGIMTRWGADDLVPTFVDMGFTVIQMPLIADYPWGQSLNPQRFTPERIEKLRQQKGDSLFAMTFMCDVQGAEGYIIRREHFRYWDSTTLPEHPLQIFIGVDPAASTRGHADRAAIATIGYDAQARRKYLLDIWADRVEVPDLKRRLIQLGQRTAGLRAVGLETVGFQLGLMQELRREAQLPLKEIPYRSRRSVMRSTVGIDRDKTGRAMYLDSQFTSGKLYLPRQAPAVQGISLESELCTFGLAGTKVDDRADAISFACIMADAAAPSRILVKMRAW